MALSTQVHLYIVYDTEPKREEPKKPIYETDYTIHIHFVQIQSSKERNLLRNLKDDIVANAISNKVIICSYLKNIRTLTTHLKDIRSNVGNISVIHHTEDSNNFIDTNGMPPYKQVVNVIPPNTNNSYSPTQLIPLCNDNSTNKIKRTNVSTTKKTKNKVNIIENETEMIRSNNIKLYWWYPALFQTCIAQQQSNVLNSNTQKYNSQNNTQITERNVQDNYNVQRKLDDQLMSNLQGKNTQANKIQGYIFVLADSRCDINTKHSNVLARCFDIKKISKGDFDEICEKGRTIETLLLSYVENTDKINGWLGNPIDAPYLSIVHIPQDVPFADFMNDVPSLLVYYPRDSKIQRCVNIMQEQYYGDYMYDRNYYYTSKSHQDLTYYIRYVDGDTKLEKLIQDNWWFDYIFNKEPLCAKGKLVQEYGTCWMHSTLNSIFLTEHLNNLLRKQWHIMGKEEKDSICGKGFAKSNICQAISDYCYISFKGMRNELFKIFYNVFINKQAMTTRDPNIIEDVSILVENEAEQVITSSNEEKELLYNKGGQPVEAIASILDELYQQSNVDFLLSEVNFRNFQYFNGGYVYSWPEFVVLSNIDYKMSLDDVDSVPLSYNVTLDDETKQYVLRAANLLYGNKSSRHVIAGLWCDGEYYVFDSNNYLVKFDWWKNDHSAYLKKATYLDDAKFINWQYLIYVPSTENASTTNTATQGGTKTAAKVKAQRRLKKAKT